MPHVNVHLSAEAGAWVRDNCLNRWTKAPDCALREISELIMRKLVRRYGDLNTVLSTAPDELAESFARGTRARGFTSIGSLMASDKGKHR